MDNLYFSTLNAEQIVKLDLPAAGEAVIAKNVEQVYYAANSWLFQLQDFGVPKGIVLAFGSVIRNAGLTRTVTECRAIAKSYLEELGACRLPDEHFFRKRCSDPINAPIGLILDFIQEEVALSDVEAVELTLQSLLYLERFTYCDAPDDGSIRKFVDINNVCRTYEYDWSIWPGPVLIQHMRDALSEILTQRNWHYTLTDCGFSSGSYLEAMLSENPDKAWMKSPLGKWKALAAYRSNVYGIQYPLPSGSNSYRRYRQPALTLVPKSLDSKRVIGPEDVVINFYGHGALEAMRKMLKLNGSMRYINERDQSVNRELARIGSKTGEWATIDMSSASDSMSKALVHACVPAWFGEVLMSYEANDVLVPYKTGTVKKKLFTLLTSGNPLTWLFESVWFLAIGRVAASLCGDKHPQQHVFAYGDDLIVRTEAYDATVELLERFGHTVNLRKSYNLGSFRESCGGWFYKGNDVTPTFWPRREVPSRKAELLSCVIDLQHKFMRREVPMNRWDYRNTVQFAEESALKLFPKVTRSSLFSDYSDLWDPSLDEYYDSQCRHTRICSERKAHDKHLLSYATYIAYVQYLIEGPLYITEEDKAWGISSSRLDNLMHYDTGRLTIR